MAVVGAQVARFDGLRWALTLRDGSVVLKCATVAACPFSEAKGWSNPSILTFVDHLTSTANT